MIFVRLELEENVEIVNIVIVEMNGISVILIWKKIAGERNKQNERRRTGNRY